jgi:hypothetical protein
MADSGHKKGWQRPLLRLSALNLRPAFVVHQNSIEWQ